jgi:hypothetical protein
MFGLEIKWMAEHLARTAASYKESYVGLDRAALIASLEANHPPLRLSAKDDFWSFPLQNIPFKCCFSAIGNERSHIMFLGHSQYLGFALHVGLEHAFTSAKPSPFEGGPTRKAIQLCKKLEAHGITDMTGRL